MSKKPRFRTDDKYSLRNSESVLQPIQIQLSKKQINFLLNIFLDFWNLHQVLNISQTKMTFIGYVFSKLSTEKDVLR